jgi:hypothetical protein
MIDLSGMNGARNQKFYFSFSLPITREADE